MINCLCKVVLQKCSSSHASLYTPFHPEKFQSYLTNRERERREEKKRKAFVHFFFYETCRVDFFHSSIHKIITSLYQNRNIQPKQCWSSNVYKSIKSVDIYHVRYYKIPSQNERWLHRLIEVLYAFFFFLPIAKGLIRLLLSAFFYR